MVSAGRVGPALRPDLTLLPLLKEARAELFDENWAFSLIAVFSRIVLSGVPPAAMARLVLPERVLASASPEG